VTRVGVDGYHRNPGDTFASLFNFYGALSDIRFEPRTGLRRGDRHRHHRRPGPLDSRPVQDVESGGLAGFVLFDAKGSRA
jgi:hypothetical protein